MVVRLSGRRVVLVLALAFLMWLVFACSAFSPSGVDSSDVDGSPNGDDASANDGTLNDVDDADSPGSPEVVMVTIPLPLDAGSYRIDATEVTQEQYAAFLKAKNGDTAQQQITQCKTTNNSFQPSLNCAANPFEPVSRGKYPGSCVDWCDAFEYCRWANKRLCGAVAGGSVLFNQANTNASQWYAACSHHDDGLHGRAYGNTFEPMRCNGAGYDAGAPIPVGTATMCIGGYPGLHDMMGNVYEWEDACVVKVDGGALQCRIRGGAFNGQQDYHYCAWAGLDFTRDFSAPDIGFRCCSLE
jgi:sulfatase modifying factor 1